MDIFDDTDTVAPKRCGNGLPIASNSKTSKFLCRKAFVARMKCVTCNIHVIPGNAFVREEAEERSGGKVQRKYKWHHVSCFEKEQRKSGGLTFDQLPGFKELSEEEKSAGKGLLYFLNLNCKPYVYGIFVSFVLSHAFVHTQLAKTALLPSLIRSVVSLRKKKMIMTLISRNFFARRSKNARKIFKPVRRQNTISK